LKNIKENLREIDEASMKRTLLNMTQGEEEDTQDLMSFRTNLVHFEKKMSVSRNKFSKTSLSRNDLNEPITIKKV
jgi:hypothetical protein